MHAQFRKTPMGMMRSDPQDAGPGYRNVVGVPGGVASPFFQILKVSCCRHHAAFGLGRNRGSMKHLPA